MYPLCSRLAPPPPLPPLVPVSTPTTVQSIPQQNLLETGNTISVTNNTGMYTLHLGLVSRWY